MSYVELQVTSNFSFRRGGSHPEELVDQAADLGYDAIAITDRNTFAGLVRGYVIAKGTLEQVRQATQQRVLAARVEIEQSAATARLQIEAVSAELSAQILKAILPAGASPEATQ